MLDIKFIRENIDLVKENTRKRKSNADIDEILKLDAKKRDLIVQVEVLRHEINTASKQKPSDEEIQKLRSIKENLSILEEELKEVEENLFQKLSSVPNMSSEDMPEGLSDMDNVEIKAWIPGEGYLEDSKLGKGYETAQYMPKKERLLHHQDLGEKLDILDNKQSAIVSGSRFVYLKNEAVILQNALFQLLFSKLLEEGFMPLNPPILVKEKVLFGTSHFPEGRDQVYQIKGEFVEDQNELFLVGSSEPSIFAYFMNKTLKEEDLPQKVFAYTPCFRSEVGSWGKDVRGIKRVHQFDKLEMDAVTTAEQSNEMLEYLLSINEWFLQQLKLPYHIVNKCHGDCGYNATYKQYDLEVWLPGQQEFMEVGSDTNATDYQARRMDIKYETKGGERKYAHTVNDTGCPMGRMIIAILENYQQEDGSVKIPEVLQKYTGFSEIKPKK